MTISLIYSICLLAIKDPPSTGIIDQVLIREGDKVRTQSFKGVVIQIKGRGQSKTFTIRKMSGTVGVERIFPINMPALKKIEVNKKGKVRQSRIYYFRELRGKKARIKEV